MVTSELFQFSDDYKSIWEVIEQSFFHNYMFLLCLPCSSQVPNCSECLFFTNSGQKHKRLYPSSGYIIFTEHKKIINNFDFLKSVL